METGGKQISFVIKQRFVAQKRDKSTGSLLSLSFLDDYLWLYSTWRRGIWELSSFIRQQYDWLSTEHSISIVWQIFWWFEILMEGKFLKKLYLNNYSQRC